MELQTWLKVNNIVYQQEGSIYTIDQKQYYHIHHKQDIIFDSEFNLIISEQELFRMNENNITDVIFYFGSKWYYCDYQNTQLNLLKYLGQSSLYDDTLNCFLGVHGKYELLNGTRDYNDWCKKALFAGYRSLGICEKHTLAGSFTFQKDCLKNNIKPIIGETLTVIEDEDGHEYKYDVKLYVINNLGWKNLLKLHHIHNILNHEKPHITENDLIQYGNNLYIVICTDTDILNVGNQILNLKTYYQLDFCEFISDTKDKERLLNIQQYFQNLQIEPILISDAYYLDSEDYKTKIILNEIGKTGFQNLSKNQYLKHFSEIVDQSQSLFKDDEFFADILSIAINNSNKLHDECDFVIKKDQSYLPQYIMNHNELSQFASNSDLFYSLIEKGFEKKVVNKNLDFDKYQQRLSYEIEVLEKGNVIDYFLILKRDVIDFCKDNNILTGVGRGSSAGSLVAYLLDIVEVDPIEYNLLFERFLNEGRLLKGTLPDIDSDVPSYAREQIINNLINRYGKDNVSFIGTSQVLKTKSLFKDLMKYKGLNFQEVNKITSIIDKDDVNESVIALFKLSANESKLKNIINLFPDLFEMFDLLLFQPRSFGIHAAGVVITSSNIHDLMPMRLNDGNLITEWEKDILEDNGFLKLDLLGLTQLDKISKILELIKKNHNKDINIHDINIQDSSVYDLFQKGLNEDIFQFGTDGLKKYCKKLKPENINDLIAANALYRPGTMDSGMHEKYIRVKNGQEDATYDIGTFEATKDTFGIAIYQEQIMQIFSDVGGFNLVEADDVRKYMGKKDKEALDRSKEKFIQGGISKGYNELDLNHLWENLETFSRYGFNRSHSAAYSITGYYTQWLKVYYPIEFYAVALEFASEDSIGNIISEINIQKHIKLENPDINKSLIGFSNFSDSIFWGLLSIKYLGEKVVSKILLERQNGEFYSFGEFLQRCGSFCNKRVLTNLVLTGCFDKIENITTNNINQRILLLSNFLDDAGIQEYVKTNSLISNIDFILKQKELCGYGYIDFNRSNSTLIEQIAEDNIDKFITVYALLNELKEYNTKNGVMGRITLEQNGKQINSILWNDCYIKYKDILSKSIKKPITFNGVVKKDNRSNNLTLQSTKFSKIFF